MADEVSVLRLYVMRSMYLLNCALVGSGVLVSFAQRQRPWDPMPGVAFSFWAALAAVSALGIRYPLAMLPVFFMQLFYKAFWMIAVYVPLQSAGRSTDMMAGMLVGLVLDLLVIPWRYAFAHYVRQRGDRWRAGRPIGTAITAG